MRINLIYLLPFALPYAILGLLRSMFYLSGGEWSTPQHFAVVSTVVGLVVGFFALLICIVNGVEITIGRKK